MQPARATLFRGTVRPREEEVWGTNCDRVNKLAGSSTSRASFAVDLVSHKAGDVRSGAEACLPERPGVDVGAAFDAVRDPIEAAPAFWLRELSATESGLWRGRHSPVDATKRTVLRWCANLAVASAMTEWSWPRDGSATRMWHAAPLRRTASLRWSPACLQRTTGCSRWRRACSLLLTAVTSCHDCSGSSSASGARTSSQAWAEAAAATDRAAAGARGGPPDRRSMRSRTLIACQATSG